jgi:hypothetical protein
MEDGGELMKTDKEKLIDFVNNLTPEEFNYLAANFEEIAATLAAASRPVPLDNSQLTA